MCRLVTGHTLATREITGFTNDYAGKHLELRMLGISGVVRRRLKHGEPGRMLISQGAFALRFTQLWSANVVDQ